MAVSDILDIQRMIDLIVNESNGLTHKGVVEELRYISRHIDKQIADMEDFYSEEAEAYERYVDAILVGSEQ
jgi:acetyl-CoA carboxylase alpha subunit